MNDHHRVAIGACGNRLWVGKTLANSSRTASLFMYAMLLYRDCFVGGSPLLSASVGDKVVVKAECVQHYLFCDMGGDVPLDCLPMLPGKVSDSTRRLLKRMGSKPRGHWAHRSPDEHASTVAGHKKYRTKTVCL
jgi:hypothetical protein